MSKFPRRGPKTFSCRCAAQTFLGLNCDPVIFGAGSAPAPPPDKFVIPSPSLYFSPTLPPPFIKSAFFLFLPQNSLALLPPPTHTQKNDRSFGRQRNADQHNNITENSLNSLVHNSFSLIQTTSNLVQRHVVWS